LPPPFLCKLVYNKVMIKYCIHPGSVTTREGEVQTFTYFELMALYGVEEEECIDKQFVPQSQDMLYIHLKPRVDEEYPNMSEQVDLGDEIKWGPDWDPKKRFTMETNYEALYSARNAERLP